MTKWRVSKTGVGSAVFDQVRVIEGGALECSNLVSVGNWSNAEPRVVAFFGPGMWISAVEEDS